MKISSLQSIKKLAVSHNAKIKKQVLISNGEIDKITNFSQAVFPPGEIACAHYHPDMVEVFFILSGQGVITVNEQSIPLTAGTCVTVEPNEIHELANTGLTDMTVMYFGVRTE